MRSFRGTNGGMWDQYRVYESTDGFGRFQFDRFLAEITHAAPVESKADGNFSTQGCRRRGLRVHASRLSVSQLPPVLRWSNRVAVRHVDHDHRDQLARISPHRLGPAPRPP